MMIDKQVGRVDQVTQSCPMVWQKGVAPCFPHQINGWLWALSPLHILLRRKGLAFPGRWTQPIDARVSDRTNTGLIWTAKTSWGELSIRNASESSFKGQG